MQQQERLSLPRFAKADDAAGGFCNLTFWNFPAQDARCTLAHVISPQD
jgi:hypothetical protein